MGNGVEPTDAQLKQVWDVLDALKEGEIADIKKYAPKRPDLWIDCAKMYHDCYNNIIFSNDFTQVKKQTFNLTIIP